MAVDLASALAEAGAASLRPRGFVPSGSRESNRGSTAEITNGRTLITVNADWLEGELAITIQVAGEPAVPIEQLVDLAGHAVHLRRLRKGMKRRTLVAQLQRAIDLLVAQSPQTLEPPPGSN